MMPDTVRRVLTAVFAVLSAVSERAAAAAAFRLFTTPIGARSVKLEGRRRERAQSLLQDATRQDYDGIATWIWESGEEEATVILVHGWTSRTLYMTGFVEPLREAGYRVVAFDFPGHGESRGQQLDFRRAAQLVVNLARQYPRVTLVGHSFGASMAVLAAAGAPTLSAAETIDALVLVAGADRLEDVTGRFADTLSLRPSVKRRIDARLEEIGGDTLDRFTSVHGILEAGLPTLCIHDREDRVVPFSDAERIVAQTQANLVEVTKVGHNRILYADSTHQALLDFLRQHFPVELIPA